jgi:lysophospholipase L1-like esterase
MNRHDAPRLTRRAATLTAAAAALGGAILMAGEVAAARMRHYARPTLDLAARASLGPAAAQPLRMTLLGDATALGVGVESALESVGGQLAQLLATSDRRVELSSAAVAGSRCADLAPQVARALIRARPDVAVILVGAGDATRLGRPARAAGHLAAAVQRLREAGVEVVVGTCPDLGALPAFAPPLRQVFGWSGRRVGRAQAEAVRAASGHVVDLAAETGTVFRADPGALCFDGFHPSADGYRVWAHALYPAVAIAVQFRPRSR